MRAKGLSDAAIAAFKRNFDQLVAGVTGMVPEADITAVAELPDLRSMPQAEAHAVKVCGVGGWVTSRQQHRQLC